MTRTGMERWHGHGQRRVFCRALSCGAWSVYLCRCCMMRRGLGGRPAVGPEEGKEEQPFQKLSVVASSGFRTTTGAGFLKSMKRSRVPLCVRSAGVLAASSAGALCRSPLPLPSRPSPPRPPPRSHPTSAAAAYLVCAGVLCVSSSSESSLASTVLPSEAQYSRFQLRDVGRDSRGRVLSTEAQ